MAKKVDMSKIRVGIIGAAGYAAGELIRLLIYHSKIDLVGLQSNSCAGLSVHEIHDDLCGQCDLMFSKQVTKEADLYFICKGHGKAKSFILENQWLLEKYLIDFSQDFRIIEGHSFIYGLAEWQKEKIKNAKHIANPGCFATAIQLALLPLANSSQLSNNIHITGITGSSGAGQALRATTHFTWRNNNVSVYKAFEHQHLREIKQTLGILQSNPLPEFYFIPVRGNFTRGIMCSVYLPFSDDLADTRKLYEDYYRQSPFIHISHKNPHLKQVVNTNNTILHVDKRQGQLLIMSILDNLLKGAAGQAVQNMNLMFGWPEDEGLKLKASTF